MEGDGCGGAREVKPLVKSRVSALTRHPLGKITWFKGRKLFIFLSLEVVSDDFSLFLSLFIYLFFFF